MIGRAKTTEALPDRLEVLRRQARYIGVGPYAVAAIALRFGFADALDLVSLMATDGRLDHAGVTKACDDFIATGQLHADDELRAAFSARGIGAVARVLVGRQYRDPDFGSAARMHRFAHALGPIADQPFHFPGLLVQTNLAAGQHDYVARILAEDPDIADEQTHWVVRTDRLSPRATGEAFDAEAWCASFNEVFAPESLAPVRIGAGPGPLFDRLEVADRSALPAVDSSAGPLVTVIMSVYAPDHSLDTAVRSILDQTWSRLELLVVDDCSPAEHTARIDALAELDPRIRVLHMPENGGTYQIRNAALRHARGELVTFQDSDDWSHPERLARQVAVLQQRPEVVASLTTAVRMPSDLTLNLVGYAPTRVNVSSLMFRRTEVLERLGGFDPVRKGADTEFWRRLEIVFGEDAVVALPDVAAVTQLTTDSLSRDDYAFGWRAATRLAYTTGYRHWHQQIAAGASPFRDPDPASPRPFAAPRAFLGRQVEPVTCDVAYISDWRVGVHRYDGAVPRVRSLIEAGLDVQLGESIALRHAFRNPRQPLPEVLEMRAAGDVGWLLWTEPVDAAVTVVDSPELLMFPRDAAGVRVTTRRLVVLAGCGPRLDNGGELYDARTVERRGRELLGVDVEWWPADAEVAQALRAAGANGTILSPRPFGVASAADRLEPGMHSPPTLGMAYIERESRDRLKGMRIAAALPPGGPYDVRVLDEDGVVPRLFVKNPVPDNWTAVKGVSVAEFLRDIDVFVGHTPEAWGAVALQPMLEALAVGAVLVVDERHRRAFGDAALYGAPEDVIGLVEPMVADPARWQAQRERGLQFARTVLDPADFAAYVASLRP
ncbi:glycosyltransferase [Aeromicrobium sp. SMF47]|uniref:glycosyltransferase n=1 Tax=Aeromicrobium yanjiei TaxID=2662028 RepID=UPI00129D386C|nr:glycosyltransferase family A protein [Aeromicrobium yanjiei]MRJ75239.1 glycosyltransferase [Aeromicrobium yanjiei]